MIYLAHFANSTFCESTEKFTYLILIILQWPIHSHFQVLESEIFNTNPFFALSTS